jgi:hypothetical protein
MYKKLNILGLASLMVLMLGVSAHATPITGTFTISSVGTSSAVVPVRLNGTQTFAFNSQAVALDFTNSRKPNGLFNSTPGVPGNFLVTSATGDFNAFAALIGQIKDFAYSGLGNSTYVNPNHTAVTSWEVASSVSPSEHLSVTLTSVSIMASTPGTLSLSGNVVFNITGCAFSCGFSPTAGVFTLFASQKADVFSFSADNAVPHVPEPITVSLLGLGLVGLGIVKRIKG